MPGVGFHLSRHEALPTLAVIAMTVRASGSQRLTRIRELDVGGVVSLAYGMPSSWENGVCEDNQTRQRRALN
jgi:hypothetical protein